MSNLKLVINNSNKEQNQRYFFEKKELKIILDLYAKIIVMLLTPISSPSISSKRVSFSVFRNAAEKAIYNICKNFKPSNKNLKYLITDRNGKILNNAYDLEVLLKRTNWKKL